MLYAHLHLGDLLSAVELGLARALPHQRQPRFRVLRHVPVPTIRRAKE